MNNPMYYENRRSAIIQNYDPIKLDFCRGCIFKASCEKRLLESPITYCRFKKERTNDN